jgi:hypothetical protein
LHVYAGVCPISFIEKNVSLSHCIAASGINLMYRPFFFDSLMYSIAQYISIILVLKPEG